MRVLTDYDKEICRHVYSYFNKVHKFARGGNTVQIQKSFSIRINPKGTVGVDAWVYTRDLYNKFAVTCWQYKHPGSLEVFWHSEFTSMDEVEGYAIYAEDESEEWFEETLDSTRWLSLDDLKNICEEPKVLNLSEYR